MNPADLLMLEAELVVACEMWRAALEDLNDLIGGER